MEIDESSSTENIIFENERDKIIDFLTSNNQVIFKLQQIGDNDLNKQQKFEIALEIFEKSKKFSQEDQEIDLIMKQLIMEIRTRNKQVKNRRYEALKQLIKEDEYFSDIEMMKRNPVLYEELVGQYLTPEEKCERDKYKMDGGVTFVKILMEGIERDNAEATRKKLENEEEEQTMETDSDNSERSESPPPCTSRWGEYDDAPKQIHKQKPKAKFITADERKLLKEEFVTHMYQSFLDGNDLDFDYGTVDDNVSYDDMDQIDHDAEDAYFDSEDPETIQVENGKVESSEDELDIYMSALNDHPAVRQLSVEMQKL
ncbi:coiled-coil domain-containing protein 97 isoform X2 [Aethina tumida]|uniref:coiled-coil domain-containing protein 97 isoform X2 n=1 Tax=Aethina tumida TaxID=116153 RepID=UPI00096B550B|nr:coiled-coil domain-containing protein 97 isoform X2 [Aethina tumida]